MGHLVHCFTYDYGKTEKQQKENIEMIKFESNQWAEYESDCHGPLYSSIQFNQNMIFESYDEASEYLKHINTDYYQGAVLFKNYEKKENSKSENIVKIVKKIDLLDKKIDKEEDDFENYVKKNNVKNRKSIYVGCTGCGSKLHKDYIRLGYNSQNCPLCGNNLFSDTVKTRIAKYESDIKEMVKQKKQLLKDLEKSKHTGNYTLNWCVKLEIHV